jgi:hypothetical protein
MPRKKYSALEAALAADALEEYGATPAPRRAPTLSPAQVAYLRGPQSPSALSVMLAMPCGPGAFADGCREHGLSEAALRVAFAFYHAHREVRASDYLGTDGKARHRDGAFDPYFGRYYEEDGGGWGAFSMRAPDEEPEPPQEWCLRLIEHVLAFHARTTDDAGKPKGAARPKRNRRTRAEIEQAKRHEAAAPARRANAARARAAYKPRPKPTRAQLAERALKGIKTRERKLAELRALPWSLENLEAIKRAEYSLWRANDAYAAIILRGAPKAT